MVCLDAKCGQNECICHYCLFENHSGHQIIPLDLILESFQSKFMKNPPSFDFLKLKARISCFDEVKENYLQKLNEFQEAFNTTIEGLKNKLKSVFGPDSELKTLRKAYHILSLAKHFEKGIPDLNAELQKLIAACVQLITPQEKEQFDENSLFDLKSINNGLDLSISRLNMFETKLSKIIQKTLKTVDSDFKFIVNQTSLVSFGGFLIINILFHT